MPQPLPESPLLELVRKVRDPGLPALAIGHRGDSQNAPENTLAAFARAVAAGAQMVEFDIRQAACGELVVVHDERVDRTSDGQGEVSKMSLDELRELSFGAWFSPEFAGERIPTLDETLDLLVAGRCVPMVEIKGKTKLQPDVAERVARLLARHGISETSIVIPKDPARAKQLQEHTPQTPLCYLTLTKGQARSAVKIPGVVGVDIYWKSLSLGLIQELRQGGCFLTPWTVNRARDMDRLLELGVTAIISDAPVTLLDRIERFEFDRAPTLVEAFARGEQEDVDLEVEVELTQEEAEEEDDLLSSAEVSGFDA